MAEVISFPGVGYDCNSYLILDEKNILIDTGMGSNRNLVEKINKRIDRLDLVINTHAHLDHVGGNSFFNASKAIHEADVNELERGGLYGTSDLFGRNSIKTRIDRVLNDGDIIECGEGRLKVVHTPGHTPGGICLVSSTGHLFSGDTLFPGGSFGRTDLPGGSSKDLLGSLERLNREAFEFLMPGHMECVGAGKTHLEAALRLLGDVYERI